MSEIASQSHRDSACIVGACFVLGCALLAYGFLNREAVAPTVHVHPSIQVHAPASPAPVVHVAAPETPAPAVTVHVPRQEAPQIWNVMPLPGRASSTEADTPPLAPPAEVLSEALDISDWGALLPEPKK